MRTSQGFAFLRVMVIGAIVAWSSLTLAIAVPEDSHRLHAERLVRDSKAGAFTWDVPAEQVAPTPEKLILPSPPDGASSIHHLIFNPILTKEFSLRYEERFGRTTAEQTYNVFSNPYVTVRTSQGFELTAAQASDSQRQFGEYMMRRLAEWHADNAMRNSKSLRAVAEIKDRYSKADVQVAPGYKIQANYSIGNNAIDVVFENPWVLLRARVEMMMNETFITMGRSIGMWRAETHWSYNDGVVKLVTSRPLKPGLSMSLMGSTPVKSQGYSVRENLGLAGLSYSF